MPKYVGNQEYNTPKTPFREKLAIATQGIAQGIQAYGQLKQMEEARAILNNPEATPIQRAIALANLGNEKLGSEVYKGSIREAENAALAAQYGQGNFGGGNQQMPRDRSWVPDLSGRTAPIREAIPVQDQGAPTLAQPNVEEGTPTQRPFTVGGPQQASRNAVRMPGGLGLAANQFAPAPQVPEGTQAPQMQQAPMDPYQQAAQMRQQAGQMNIIRPGTGNALLSQADAIEKQALTAQKLRQDIYESERDYATKLTENFRKNQSALRDSLPIKEQAFQLAEQALATGDVGAFSGANLARRTGMNEFESASGAGLNLAAKEFLIGNLSQVSARAQNRWLEQIMSSAFPRVGQSTEANETVLEGIRAAHDLAKMKLEIGSQLEQEDLKKLGYVDKDIEHRVDAALQPEAKKILDRLSYRTKVLSESEKSPKQLAQLINKKVPNGTFLTRKMFNVFKHKLKTDTAALERAKMLGYRIPTNADVQGWINE